MKYGINESGKMIEAVLGLKGERYECPYCSEELTYNKGKVQSSYFSHSIIKNRTPLQRACPEYKEGQGFSKVSDELEIVYINNGGVPLYLYDNNINFELRACLPHLNISNTIKLKINESCKLKKYRKIYNLKNFKYYQVKTIQDWIDIEIEGEVAEEDYIKLKNKYLWGIRGIDIDRDIYYSRNDGGYRLALKSNIIMNKKYLILSKNIPDVKGVNFSKKGEINLLKYNEKLDTMISVNYLVLEFIINQLTFNSRTYIEKKGYNLSFSNNKIIPIWPPHIKQGKELISENENMFLYVEKNVFLDGLSETIEIEKKSKQKEYKVLNNLIKLDTDTSVLKNYNRSKIISKEIVFNLSKIRDISKKRDNNLKKIIILDTTNNNEIEFDSIIKSDNFRKRYEVISNYFSTILVKEDGLIIYSDECFIDHLDYGRELNIILDNKIIYKYYCEEKKKEKLFNIDIEYLVNLLKQDSSDKINSYRYLDVLNYISKLDIDESMYSFIRNKILNEGVSIYAREYLDKIWRLING